MRRPSEEAARWLETRAGRVPTALFERIVTAVRCVDREVATPAEVFQLAADALVQETLTNQARSDAVTLLAADALITYVCEYCSESEPENLARLL